MGWVLALLGFVWSSGLGGCRVKLVLIKVACHVLVCIACGGLRVHHASCCLHPTACWGFELSYPSMLGGADRGAQPCVGF